MRIETRELLAVLTDLLATVEPKLPRSAVVELHTGRGHYGDEPGVLTLLCGASTTGHAAGHTYTPCDEPLPGGPVLLAHHDAKAICDVFREAAKTKDPVHSVEVRRDGNTLHVREDPNLIDDGLSLSFSLAEADRFPLTVYRTLAREQRADVGDLPPATRTDLTRGVLEPFVKVAKRRGDYLRVYRTHQAEIVHVQIGEHYRGVLLPAKPSAEGDHERPDADVHAPDGVDIPDPEHAAGEVADPDAAMADGLFGADDAELVDA